MVKFVVCCVALGYSDLSIGSKSGGCQRFPGSHFHIQSSFLIFLLQKHADQNVLFEYKNIAILPL